MVQKLSDDISFASKDELMKEFIDKLNAELGSEALKIAQGNKLINICCMFRNCPMKLSFSFERTKDGELTSFKPGRT